MTSTVDPAKVRSVLIVKLSSIGDVVHALPVAGALRRRYPSARISWAVEAWTAPLVIGHPAIDRVVVLPPMRWGEAGSAWVRAFTGAVRRLRADTYDVSLDLQSLFKSSLVAVLSRAPLRLGLAEQREGARFVSRAVPASQERIHVVDDYLRCAEFVGASPVPVSFDLPVHPSAATTIKHLLAGLRLPSDVPLIAINPSASVAWKSAAAAYWSQVVNALANDGTVLLVGSANQIGHHAEIARLSRARVYDFTGRTSLAELVALLRRCTIHVAPDTGSAHIAAALGCPVAGLYGPTPPWRKAPYGCEDLVAQRHDLCSSGCPRACRHKLQCLQAVTPDDLVGQARRALTRARTGHRRTDLC